MTVAKAAAIGGAGPGHCVVAKRQRAGRGRSGAPWVSEPGAGVWMTVVLAADPRWPTASLSPAMALGVGRAAIALGAHAARLKWPNDVLVGDRKIAGLLLERGNRADGSVFVLLGVGLNLVTPALLPMSFAIAAPNGPLQPIGLDEAGATGVTADVALVGLLSAIGDVHATYQQGGFAPLAAAFDAMHAWRGRHVTAFGAGAAGEDETGVVGDVQVDGSLTLITPTGPKTMLSATLRLAGSSGS